MIKCPICEQELICISMLHLKKHGYKNLNEFRQQYPNQELGDCKGHPFKKKIRREEVKDKNGKSSFKYIKLEEGGRDAALRVPESEFQWFVLFREAHEWDSKTAISALLTLWHENEDSEIVKTIIQRIDGGQRLAHIDPNPARYHHEKLEEAIRDLEQAIKNETNPLRKAQEIKALGEVNKIRAELEKTYLTVTDEKIERLIENRKLICRNYLPKLLEDASYDVETEDNQEN